MILYFLKLDLRFEYKDLRNPNWQIEVVLTGQLD